MQLNGLIHLGSGACIGRCWDYGNYEPATAQFRVQASGPNGVVADNMAIVAEIEHGRHVVTAQEAPLYSVCPRQRFGHPVRAAKTDRRRNYVPGSDTGDEHF